MPDTRIAFVAADTEAIRCGDQCASELPRGTQIRLIATPESGSSFRGWSEPCGGAGACALTLEASLTVAATFTKTDYPLSVELGGEGLGQVTSSPAGIQCGDTCSARFGVDETVILNPVGSVTSNARLPHSVSCGSESSFTPDCLARAAT